MYKDSISGERGGTIENLAGDACKTCGVYKSNCYKPKIDKKREHRYFNRAGSFNLGLSSSKKFLLTIQDKKASNSSSSLNIKKIAKLLNDLQLVAEEDIPAIIKPPCHYRRMMYSKMNTRQSSTLSKDIDSDLSEWHKAYERVWESGNKLDKLLFKNNKKSDKYGLL